MNSWMKPSKKLEPHHAEELNLQNTSTKINCRGGGCTESN